MYELLQVVLGKFLQNGNSKAPTEIIRRKSKVRCSDSANYFKYIEIL